jgi:hypothetical protein
VIGHDGVILCSEVNPDYTRPPEPEDMVPVLQRAAATRRGLAKIQVDHQHRRHHLTSMRADEQV